MKPRLLHSKSIGRFLREATQQLQGISDTAQLDVELLLAHALSLTRTQLLTHTDQCLTTQQQQVFNQLLKRRQQGEPIAYLIKRREFWSMDFYVTPATLIPRHETELLVELVLSKFPAHARIKLADLGTGCGAIALAIAKERPTWSVVATDKQIEALQVAQLNANKFGINHVIFRLGDWCEALDDQKFDVIVSNPPYISVDDAHLQQGDLRFEPESALVSKQQGLADLERIITSSRKHLSENGCLFVEHGYDQSENVKEFFSQCNYKKITNYTDFIGVKRVVVGSA